MARHTGIARAEQLIDLLQEFALGERVCTKAEVERALAELDELLPTVNESHSMTPQKKPLPEAGARRLRRILH